MQPIKAEIENDSQTGRSSGLQEDSSKKATSHLVVLSSIELVISHRFEFISIFSSIILYRCVSSDTPISQRVRNPFETTW